MIIVKMNDTTVECSIAASELHEIGLTPEAVINGAENTTSFFAQLGKEVGQQLDYNPETEVMMMSKNIMMDGSVRIFAVKMTNEDIKKASERIRGAALTVLNTLTKEKIEDILAKTGRDKGVAFNEVITKVSDTISKIYGRDQENALEENAEPEASYQPLSEYAKYMMEFDNLEDAERFSKVVQKLPIVDSVLYKYGGMYYLMAGLMSAREEIIYDMRRAGVEYSEILLVNAPEAMFIEEQGEKIIDSDAIVHLADLTR
ncbi:MULTISPECIES: adaptor protein MecA [unclassified Butyrivibrio]|uniref:adaptor protein MecA n=1 Tax=unclassified Butyrivibrio TaxID=2639466 RepID=UPI0008EFC610|nr:MULTISPECIES: adaptor protein MecA [unclassified Butyrivibrio]SFU58320.1 Negative regulator of genetic competence, sporulation and motility [Butyrivibrio sp. INlla21]